MSFRCQPVLRSHMASGVTRFERELMEVIRHTALYVLRYDPLGLGLRSIFSEEVSHPSPSYCCCAALTQRLGTCRPRTRTWCGCC